MRIKRGAAGAVVATLALVLSLLVVTPATAASQVVGAAVSTTGSSVEAAIGPIADTGIVKTAVVGFNPENIISDALFYDGNAMSSAEIQSFLDSKIGRCENGKCLNVLSASISSRDAWYSQVTGDLVCSALQGGTMRVSELIYRVQVACGISAKAILVTLQKEQGLTTSSAPSDWNLRAAMGASCPDTEPCDPAYSGVGPQIVQGVRQLKIYKAGRFGKQPGVNFIGYNPSASCGGTNLNIQNYATAALYNYTPYQPNAASLAAGWGLGDGCSSYGNRNFFNYYTAWFGSTQTSAAKILRSATTGTTYLVSEQKKYSFPSAERAVQFTWIASTRTVSEEELSVYSDAGPAPRAVRTSGGVYLLDSGKRFTVGNCDLARDYGWNCSTLPLVLQNQVDVYGDGGSLRPVSSGLDGMWLVQGQKRRQVVDLGLLAPYGIPNVTSSLSEAMLAEFAVGDPVVGPGIYGDGAGTVVALTTGGAYSVPAALQTPGVLANRQTLAKGSLDKIGVAAELPARIRVGNAQYVVADAGLLRVDAYGSEGFTTLPAGSTAGIPSAGAVSGPHFVREFSDGQVYLASGGSFVPVSDRQQADVRAQFGVSARIWIVADGVLPAMPVADIRFVRTTTGAIYLVDGSRLLTVPSCSIVSDWGWDCGALATVSNAAIANLADAGGLQMLVRTAGGPIWLVQSGSRREVPDTSVLARFGIPSSVSVVSARALSLLPVGGPVVAPGAYSAAAAETVVISDGGVFSLTDDSRLPVVVAGKRTLSADTMKALSIIGDLPTRMLSGGRAYVLTASGWLIVDPEAYGGTARFSPVPDRAWNGITVAKTDSRPHFVRALASDQEFLVSGGSLQPVAGRGAHEWIVARFGLADETWTVARGVLSGLTLPVGQVFRTSEGLRISDGSDVFGVPTCDFAADLGVKCADVPTVTLPSDVVVTFRSTLTQLVTDETGRPWLVQDGSRREVPDVGLLSPYGIGSAVTVVSGSLLATLPIGDPVLGSGIFDDVMGNVRLNTSTGARYSAPTAVVPGVIGDRAVRIDVGSMARFPASSGELPRRIAVRGQTFVLSPEGWLSAPTGSLGSLTVTDSGADVRDVLPTIVGPSAAFFVRERSSESVFLASGGLQSITDDEHKARISSIYGVPPRVWVVADGSLR